jgi:serine/threonine protein kinase, bacterial
MAFIRVASVVMATAALGVSGIVAGCSSGASTSSASSTNSGGSPSSPIVPSAHAAPLDGSYRIDTKFSQGTTFDGSPVPGGTDVSRWYAFRSACTPAACTAAATQLDSNDHTVAMPDGATATLRFSDGRWQTIAPIDGTAACKTHPEVRLKIATTWSFAPQSDGTLAGTKVYTEVKGGTGECAGSGRTAKYPMTLAREGAVPTGVDVAEPPPA